jgi:hypothetical protein
MQTKRLTCIPGMALTVVLMLLVVLVCGQDARAEENTSAQPLVSPFFFNKKADAKVILLEGGSNSTAKWSVSTPARYNVFVQVPASGTATSVTYRIYPNGNSHHDTTCSSAHTRTPCFEATINQVSEQGKEVQLVSNGQTFWDFSKRGFVSVAASDVAAGEVLSLGPLRFTEPRIPPSFSKISNSGEVVATTSVLGDKPNDWACTRDNNSGLIWEIRPDDGGVRDRDNQYSWYDNNPATNGGYAGTQNAGVCVGISCDTNGYVKAVNQLKLCGYSDWRLPTLKELINILDDSFVVDFVTGTAAIDPVYFPDGGPGTRLWTSQTSDENNTQAWFVVLSNSYGFAPKQFGAGFFNVRLVRGK